MHFFIWGLLTLQNRIFSCPVFTYFLRNRAMKEKAVYRLYDSNQKNFIWFYIQTHSDTILTLPDTLRHHPDTPQTSPYLVYMRPLGERIISEYHDIYSTVFNLSDICQTQISARHAQTPSRHCQTPSDTIQTPLRHPHIWSAWDHWEKGQYPNTMISIQLFSIYLISDKKPDICQTCSDTIQTPLRHPHIWPACGHWEKE